MRPGTVVEGGDIEVPTRVIEKTLAVWRRATRRLQRASRARVMAEDKAAREGGPAQAQLERAQQRERDAIAAEERAHDVFRQARADVTEDYRRRAGKGVGQDGG
jgi:hypothetical protein